MPYGEALSLTRTLRSDPTSQVAVALEGLEYPWSREANILADLFDLVKSALSQKGKPTESYPRPYQVSGVASKPTVSQEVIRKALKDRGH